jgi:hypothetical protein
MSWISLPRSIQCFLPELLKSIRIISRNETAIRSRKK